MNLTKTSPLEWVIPVINGKELSSVAHTCAEYYNGTAKMYAERKIMANLQRTLRSNSIV
jgi:hypothetical protein